VVSGRRILVTGASGFIGRALTPALRAAYPEAEILGTRGSDAETLDPSISAVKLDFTRAEQVRGVVGDFGPTDVIHLAAKSSVQGALGAPRTVWQTNVVGVLHLIDALRETAPNALLIFASSGEVYGRSFLSGRPLDEQAPLEPDNPYARSKAAAEMALRDLWGDTGRLVILRMFNHLGPGQDERFVAASFAAQVARAEQGKGPLTLRVGDLSAERDLGDVRDLVRAYLAVLDKADTFEHRTVFNICSGVSRPVKAIADRLVELSKVEISFAVDPARVRPHTVPRTAGSHAALTKATGWRPEIRFEDTISDVLSDWRRKV
jgi:GDP-4-dehydro-6-deoxy-D-mannose reductase